MKGRQIRRGEQKLTIEQALIAKKSFTKNRSIDKSNPPSPKSEVDSISIQNKQRSIALKPRHFHTQQNLLSEYSCLVQENNKSYQFIQATVQLKDEESQLSQNVKKTLKPISKRSQNSCRSMKNRQQIEFSQSRSKLIQWKLLRKKKTFTNIKPSNDQKEHRGLQINFQNLENKRKQKQTIFKRYNTLNQRSDEAQPMTKQIQSQRRYTKMHVKIKDFQGKQSQIDTNRSEVLIDRNSILKQKCLHGSDLNNLDYFEQNITENQQLKYLEEEDEKKFKTQQIQSCKIMTKTQISVINVENKFSETFDGCSKLKTLKSLKAVKSFRSTNTTFKSIFSYGQKESAMQGLKVQMISKKDKATVWKVKPYEFGDFIIKKKIHNANKSGSSQLQILNILSGHPFVVCLIEAFKLAQHDGHSIQLFMQYFPQGNLRQAIYIEGSFHLEKVKIYAYQIFRGLHFIHSKNICHMNINSENIFLRKNKIVIGGFGSAKLKKNLQKECIIVVGCEQERAPQLLFGNNYYDQKIDIWSAGCVLVQMILGQKIFKSEYPQDTLIQIIKIRGSPTKQQFQAMNPNYENVLKNWKLPQNLSPKDWKNILHQRNLDTNLRSLLNKIFQYSPNDRLSALQILSQPYFDDIRNQIYYQKISSKYRLQQDFFIFTEDQLPQSYQTLIPDWVQINSSQIF